MDILRPRIIGAVVAAIVLLLFVSLAQEMNRRWQVQRQIEELETQVNDMQRNVTHLQNLNQYFRTDDYQERLAREKLGYQAPGEKVVLIPENVAQAATQAQPDDRPTPVGIPERWWRLFFVGDDRNT